MNGYDHDQDHVHPPVLGQTVVIRPQVVCELVSHDEGGAAQGPGLGDGA